MDWCPDRRRAGLSSLTSFTPSIHFISTHLAAVSTRPAQPPCALYRTIVNRRLDRSLVVLPLCFIFHRQYQNSGFQIRASPPSVETAIQLHSSTDRGLPRLYRFRSVPVKSVSQTEARPGTRDSFDQIWKPLRPWSRRTYLTRPAPFLPPLHRLASWLKVDLLHTLASIHQRHRQILGQTLAVFISLDNIRLSLVPICYIPARCSPRQLTNRTNVAGTEAYSITDGHKTTTTRLSTFQTSAF